VVVRWVARLLSPLHARLTYRRWAGLIVGGALLMPYMMAGELVFRSWQDTRGSGLLVVIDPAVFLAVLPVIAVTGLVLPIRAVAISLSRALLGVRLEAPETDARTWPQRWRTALWFTAFLGVGGIVSGLTLAMAPFAAWLCSYPFTGDWLDPARSPGAPGWSMVWTIPLGLAILPVLAYIAAGTGSLLGYLAAALLGPTAADRLAVAERRSAELAERNRLARELHDSVGHALSVVTVQAAAAGRVLDADPAFARRALGAIEESARGALEDLDYVLGLLREDTKSADSPELTLSALPELVESTGLDVEYVVDGEIAHVPRTVSREAYRIIQEGLTNALRHGGGPGGTGGKVAVNLRLAVADDRLEVEMSNSVGGASSRAPSSRPGGGRGLRGMAERVRLLRGELDAGPEAGSESWRLHVSLPLRASAVRV
jgi:signal transduction histidine kinase